MCKLLGKRKQAEQNYNVYRLYCLFFLQILNFTGCLQISKTICTNKIIKFSLANIHANTKSCKNKPKIIKRRSAVLVV